MSESYIRQILFLVLINVLIKIFYVFGIERQVQLAVGTSAYGLYFALFNFTYLFQVINEFGIQNYNLQVIASKSQSIRTQLHLVSWAKLFLHIIFSGLLFTFALVLGYAANLRWLIFLGINQILISWISYLRTFYSGRSFYRHDAYISVLDKSLMILFIGAILIVPHWRSQLTVGWFLGLQTIALLVTALIAHVWAGDLTYVGWVKPKIQEVLSLVKACAPFVLTVFLMTVYARLDGVMIERLLPDGAHEAGIYAAGYRLLDAVNMVVFLVAIPLLSTYATHRENHMALYAVYRSTLWMIGIITIGGAVFLAVYAYEIMAWIYPGSNKYWADVLQPIIFTFIPTGLIMITSSLFTADRSLSKINIYFVGSILVNFLLNWWLILEHQALGAAWATIITQGLTAIMLMWRVKAHYRIFPGQDYLHLALHGIGLYLVLRVLCFNSNSLNHPVWGFMISGVWAITLFFIYRKRILVRPKGL